jgi:hypothetical protein
MKFKYKKYIIAINDISNMLLKKEQNHSQEQINQLKLAVKIIVLLLVVSLILNIYQYLT